MCGIAGILRTDQSSYSGLEHHLKVMNHLQAHRGPDDQHVWTHSSNQVGFGHVRLTIIDLESGQQPMTDQLGNTICFNGEIYNYLELREQLSDYSFRTHSDTEVILAAYARWGEACVDHLRGMFAFALWDEREHKLFCARDRFGIKPFYYYEHAGTFYFASEVKALLPFMQEVETDPEALQDYLVFQLSLEQKTLFKGVQQLPPAHCLVYRNGSMNTHRYWDVFFNLDWTHTRQYFEERLASLIDESVALHCRSDVPLGAYVSGGIDSSVIASTAASTEIGREHGLMAFTGRFDLGPEFDESEYAQALAEHAHIPLEVATMDSRQFQDSITSVLYHLDYPVAGPGAFPQYHVSKLASQHRKVVLGGQGGDEIFGGYTRYLIAYFEQCIKAAIDGTSRNGDFVVTYESIIPQLASLRNYKPLIQSFWSQGLFGPRDRRYYQLINRAPSLKDEVRWEELGGYDPFTHFSAIFNGDNVGSSSYFDMMTHFDFKTLLPALLQVEDRMSMAHGLESRVPFLDHPLVEFAATIPSNIKFKDGTLKMSLVNATRSRLPQKILNRTDKMGFPVPLNQWLQGELKDFVYDVFSSRQARSRRFIDSETVLDALEGETKFGRKIWGLLSLELWHCLFHDRASQFRRLLKPDCAAL